MIAFTKEELAAFACALGETLEAIEEWEFETRTGFTRDEFFSLLRKLNAVLSSEDGAGKGDSGR